MGRLILFPTPCCACHLGSCSPMLEKPHPLVSGSRPAPLAGWNLCVCWELGGTKRDRRILYLSHPFSSSLPHLSPKPDTKSLSFLKKQILSSIHFYKQTWRSRQPAKSEQSLGKASCHKKISIYRLSSSSPDLSPSHSLLRNRKQGAMIMGNDLKFYHCNPESLSL